MNIAICEDEEKQQIILEDLLNHFGKDKFEVYKYFSGEELIEACKDIPFSILFLDMQLKGMDGIKTAETMRKMDQDCIIIIITSIMEYAMEGYRINAFDFILKPIDIEKFNQVMNRALCQLKSCKDYQYVIDFRNQRTILKLGEILYIESNGRKINIICENMTYCNNNSISNEEKNLSDYGFIRISRYYLINIRHIREVSKKEVLLDNGARLNMSPRLRSRVYDYYTDYMMGGLK